MSSEDNKFKETEIGKIPEDWSTAKIGNISAMNESTITNNFDYEEIEYLDTSSAKEGKIIETTMIKLIDAPIRARRKLKENDILISTVRPNQKHYTFIKKCKDNMIASTGFVVISPKNIVPRFLYYYLTNDKYTFFLSSIAESHTSTYPSFTPDIIENSIIPIPPLLEQKAIAKVLSDLDDKIELNNEMNKILEEIGQALFKRWFIDFEFPDENGNPYISSGGEMAYSKELGKEIPKGWKVGKLGDYVILVKGVSYKSEELSKSENALVTLKSIDREGNYNIDGLKEYVGKYKDEQILFSGDIVVAHTDLTQKADVLGKPAIIREDSNYEKLIASLDLVIVRPKNEHIGRPFIYHLLKTNTFHNHAIGYANGTTVLHLNQKAIPDFEFVVPSFTVTQTFGEIIDKITLKLQDNELQSEYLAQIRDSLIPKLMSGEIRVPLEATQ